MRFPSSTRHRARRVAGERVEHREDVVDIDQAIATARVQVGARALTRIGKAIQHASDVVEVDVAVSAGRLHVTVFIADAEAVSLSSSTQEMPLLRKT